MHRFDVLADRLLRAGIAFHHVRRLIGELKDHYDDALAAEQRNGADPSAAAAAAWTRLGDPEQLVRSALARPELLAWSARFPRLWGGAPLALWLASIAGFGAALAGLVGALRAAGSDIAFLQGPLDILIFLLMRILPVVLSAAILVLTLRQRLRAAWPIAGAALTAAIAGAATATVTIAQTPGALSNLSFGLEVSSAGALRAALMFVLMVSPLAVRPFFSPRSADAD